MIWAKKANEQGHVVYGMLFCTIGSNE